MTLGKARTSLFELTAINMCCCELLVAWEEATKIKLPFFKLQALVGVGLEWNWAELKQNLPGLNYGSHSLQAVLMCQSEQIELYMIDQKVGTLVIRAKKWSEQGKIGFFIHYVLKKPI